MWSKKFPRFWPQGAWRTIEFLYSVFWHFWAFFSKDQKRYRLSVWFWFDGIRMTTGGLSMSWYRSLPQVSTINIEKKIKTAKNRPKNGIFFDNDVQFLEPGGLVGPQARDFFYCPCPWIYSLGTIWRKLLDFADRGRGSRRNIENRFVSPTGLPRKRP
jgi:hypothetical protein